MATAFEALAHVLGEIGSSRNVGRCVDCGFLKNRGGLNGYDRCTKCQEALFERTAERIRRDQPKVEIHRGDLVEIEIRTGYSAGTYRGTVLTANYWSDRDGWYIEFDRPGSGYGYWKQGPDGGVVKVLKVAGS